jgi:hypothetical protein
MDEQYDVEITGSGTWNEVLTSLKNIVKAMEKQKGGDDFTFKDYTLFAELVID